MGNFTTTRRRVPYKKSGGNELFSVHGLYIWGHICLLYPCYRIHIHRVSWMCFLTTSSSFSINLFFHQFSKQLYQNNFWMQKNADPLRMEKDEFTMPWLQPGVLLSVLCILLWDLLLVLEKWGRGLQFVLLLLLLLPVLILLGHLERPKPDLDSKNRCFVKESWHILTLGPFRLLTCFDLSTNVFMDFFLASFFGAEQGGKLRSM